LEDDLDSEMDLCDKYKEERNKLAQDRDRYLEQRNDLRKELANVEEKCIRIEKEFKAFQRQVASSNNNNNNNNGSSESSIQQPSISESTSSTVTTTTTTTNATKSANVELLEQQVQYMKDRLLKFDALLRSTML